MGNIWCLLKSLSLSDWSSIVSIATPIILLMWFYFSQRLKLSNQYYSEIAGKYAGFTETINPDIEKKENGRIYSGIILQIMDIDTNGYFKGEFQYGENLITSGNRVVVTRQLMEGTYTFLGKVDYEFYRKRDRHPYKVTDNRKYHGKLYIVDRLDYQYDKYDFQTYVQAEYDIIHFREMKAVKFKFIKAYRDGVKLPQEFILNKHIGLTFEPSEGVRFTAFKGDDTTYY